MSDPFNPPCRRCGFMPLNVHEHIIDPNGPSGPWLNRMELSCPRCGESWVQSGPGGPLLPEERVSGIMREYEEKQSIYAGLTKKLESLVIDILNESRLIPNRVMSRLKTAQSLRGKLERPDSHHLHLSDVTDIAGVRVITYFPDEVDAMISIVRDNFTVVEVVDKRKDLGVDKFGYNGVNIVVTLPQERIALIDYRRYAGLQAEIQICTILGAAWAEIEHDRRYKSGVTLTDELSRRFARLAAGLEEADASFQRLRDDIKEYINALPNNIETGRNTVQIGVESLRLFIRGNQIIQNIDTALAVTGAATLVDRAELLYFWAKDLNYVGLVTIQELYQALEDHGDLARRFGTILILQDAIRMNSPTVARGSTIGYLSNVLAARDNSLPTIRTYLDAAEIEPPTQRDAVAQRMLDAYQRAVAGAPDDFTVSLFGRHEAGQTGPLVVFVGMSRPQENQRQVIGAVHRMSARLRGAAGYELDVDVRLPNGTLLTSQQISGVPWLISLLTMAADEFRKGMQSS